jgi:hypothetical protein
VRCDEARLALSLRLDGEPLYDVDPATLDEHVAACDECSGFEGHAERVRAALRFEPVDTAPDVAPAVLAELQSLKERAPIRSHFLQGRRRTRRPLVAAAAVAAVAGVAAGAAFVGIGSEPRSPAAADLPQRIVAAQSDIGSVDARFELVERGLPGAGERRYDGRLVYESPESLALTLTPPGAPASDPPLQLAVDGDRWWQSTARECAPVPGQSICPDSARRWVRSVTGREPFSESAPVPLELVSPVDSFTLAGTPTSLGTRTIAGRDAVGVVVSAAQMASFLAGLSAGDDVRGFHPGDPVELWLDQEHLIPLEVTVRAGDGTDREPWASGQGTTERAGDAILAFAVTSLEINAPVPDDAFVPPPTSAAPDETVDAGFRPGNHDGAGADAPTPTDVPAGFRPYRSGTISDTGGPDIAVGSWTDGRAWLTVRSSDEWPGDRLFGGLGTNVRSVDLGEAGVGYVSDDGRKIALHANGLDVVVSGSVPTRDLRAAAASLGVTGRPVPATWHEAATATLAEATAATDGLLVAQDLDGFGPPAVRMAGGAVSLAYAGPGDRGFTLVQSDAPRLAPPADGDAVGVDVRGVPGRYSPERGQLEWVEGGTARSLSSPTLSLDELLTIATALEPG